MPVPKHEELANIKTESGQHRLCLDRVRKGEYAFVWRGNKRSKDGFVQRPAYFDWATLGELIKKAFNNKKITEQELKDLLINLIK